MANRDTPHLVKEAKLTPLTDTKGQVIVICDPSWFDESKRYKIANAPMRTASMEFEGEDLNSLARVLYAEASGSLQLTDENERAKEKSAIINVNHFRLNRRGYPNNAYIAKNFREVCDAPGQFESVFAGTQKFSASKQSHAAKLRERECQDLSEAIKAVADFFSNGPRSDYQFDNFRGYNPNGQGTHIAVPVFGYPLPAQPFWLKFLNYCGQMKNLIHFLIALVSPMAVAGVTPFLYHIGSIKVIEDGRHIELNATPTVSVSIKPGGATWPPLSLDETGTVYAGNILIDSATGAAVTHQDATLVLPYGIELSEKGKGFAFHVAGKTCFLPLQQLGLDSKRTALESLKNSNVAFSSGTAGLLALATQFGLDGKVLNYRVDRIDLAQCRISSHYDLGNPDLLIELGHSTAGGWWLTGSIEQTLLQSGDGNQWRKAPLPPGLSGLISAYVANPEEIWLAAILPSDETESPYLLVYSNDGGASWRNVVANDAALARLPAGWLEGQRRRIQR